GRTTNTATASASFGGGPISSPPDSVTYPVTATPALSVEKSGPTGPSAYTTAGEVVTYSYLVSNTGGAGLTEDISIIDDRIGTFVCRPASEGVFSVGDSYSCSASYTITQADVDAGSVTNVA